MICHEEFTDYNDIVPDHRGSRKGWETAIRTIFNQRIGGVTRGMMEQNGLTDGRSAANDQPPKRG